MLPDRSRGQLIVLGALLLATVLVGIALVLNGVIFAENLATRHGADSDEAIGIESQGNTTARTALSKINAANSGNRSYPTLESELDARMDEWRRSLRKRYALSGRWVDFDRTDVVRGWRIMQTNHERNFTAGGSLAHQHDWLVAENVKQVGVFEQNISRTSLYDAGYQTTKAALADSAYHIAIKEPGAAEDGFWRIYMFQGVATQNVYLLTEEPDQNFVGSTSAYVNFATGSCSYQTLEWVEVKIRTGTFGGAPCSELDFFRNLNSSYDIYYNNTAADTDGSDADTDEDDNVNRSMGTYELFVGKADVPGKPYYKASIDESPFRLTALYSANYTFGYESQGMAYQSEIRAIPDRLGTAEKSVPSVSFTYTYHSTTAEFEIDWEVSDPDGNLDQVDAYLYENATQTLLDSKENIEVSGSNAEGTTTLDSGTSLDVGAEYDIVVVVTDETDVSASEIKTHEG